MPVPGLGQHQIGRVAHHARREGLGRRRGDRRAGPGAARRRCRSGRRAALGVSPGSSVDGARRGARRGLLPFGQLARTASARRVSGLRDAGRRAPAPRASAAGAAIAAPSTRLRARASRRSAIVEQRGGRVAAGTARPRASLAGGASPAARASPRGVGTMKRAGMQEGEQFEQVEPRQLGIAEPLPDQRRVEHDHRRVGGDAGSPRRARPRGVAIGVGDPDAAMAGVERGIGEREVGSGGIGGDPSAVGTSGERGA